MPDPLFQYTVRIASGIRIAFASDTDIVELDALLTGTERPERTGPVPRFDLVIDGQVRATRLAPEGNRWVVKVTPRGSMPYDTEMRRGEASLVRFDGLVRAMKRIEICAHRR